MKLKNLNKLKKTLHGVNCEATRSVFKDLKHRGFNVGLEDGGHGTYKIISLINGRYFAISMTSSVYCKNYSRGLHRWQHFNCIDDLVMSTVAIKSESPTPKQLAYISLLSKNLGIIDYEIPKTLIDAMEMINKLKNTTNIDTTKVN